MTADVPGQPALQYNSVRQVVVVEVLSRRLQERAEPPVEGEEAALDGFVKWCHDGPGFARVTDVEEERSPATGEFSGFSIRY